jgi:SET domain-containing protein
VKKLPDDLKTKIHEQNWESIEIRSNLPEGRGIFAKRDIPAHQAVCNYGGQITESKGLLILKRRKRCNNLLELQLTKLGKKLKVYLHGDSDNAGKYGPLINHSQKHPSLKPEFYIDENNTIDIVFFAFENIPKGEQLTWNYGKHFEGVEKCVRGCKKCAKC